LPKKVLRWRLFISIKNFNKAKPGSAAARRSQEDADAYARKKKIERAHDSKESR
jgi:hypothetical protein